mgnify:CR=1 FL=1
MYTSSEVYSPAPSPYSVAVGRISKDQWLALQEHILDTINRATTAADMAVFITFINVPQDSFNFMTRDEVQQETRAALVEISMLQHYLEEIASHDLDDLMKTERFICQFMPNQNLRKLIHYVHSVKSNLQAVSSKLVFGTNSN